MFQLLQKKKDNASDRYDNHGQVCAEKKRDHAKVFADKKLISSKKVKAGDEIGVFDFSDGTAVSVENVRLHYGSFLALESIDMEIPSFGITAFIGPSGCGKSTLLKCLNRMNDLVEGCKIEGSIKVGGRDIYAPDCSLTALRKNVGMVFQKPNPFPMSVYDNIAYAPRTFGIRKRQELDAIVERSLKQAAMWDELKDRLNKSAMGLSGGQQQRLCIARALSVAPQILLLDEPTSALDPISTGKIEELCTELKREVTIVMVTHNMQQAARISDKTGFFLLGKLIEYGDTDAVFSNPEQEETERYITGRFG